MLFRDPKIMKTYWRLKKIATLMNYFKFNMTEFSMTTVKRNLTKTWLCFISSGYFSLCKCIIGNV